MTSLLVILSDSQRAAKNKVLTQAISAESESLPYKANQHKFPL
jgi:hypothetical protein